MGTVTPPSTGFKNPDCCTETKFFNRDKMANISEDQWHLPIAARNNRELEFSTCKS